MDLLFGWFPWFVPQGLWVGQTIKIIVDGGTIIRAVEKRSMAFSFNVAGRRCHVARSSHSFNNLAAYTSVLPVYQTSGSKLTKPVVYSIAFDKDSAAELFPLGNVDSVVRLTAKSVSFNGGVVEMGTSKFD